MNKITNSLHYPRRWAFRQLVYYSSYHSIGLSNHCSTRNITFNRARGHSGPIRIGCASGFWGDTPTAVGQLINHGRLDFLVLDYLSEVTMSLLVAARQKNKDLGWCPDFAQTIGPFLGKIKKDGIKVVANAGGINPQACMEAVMAIAKKSEIDLKVAVILGDDLLHLKDKVSVTMCPAPDKITSMNAYLGAGPISRALDMKADIVICGRCTDSALALGPLIHKFKWSMDDWDLMAAGSLAGHLIECGAQVTGGICTDWDKVDGWENNGFPIAVCEPTGKVTITKPDGTGGLINRGTVAEQLLYEIGDPTAYMLPDVICDFSDVRVTEHPEGVEITRAMGKLPTKYYKVGGTYQDGWKCTAVCPIIGPRAVEKGEKTAKAILARCNEMYKRMNLPYFSRVHIQVLGSEQAYGENARKANLETRDAVLWMGVENSEKQSLDIFSREIASAGTGMAPGLTAIIGGRPKVAPVLRFFSFLHDKEFLQIKILTSDGYEEEYVFPAELAIVLGFDMPDNLTLMSSFKSNFYPPPPTFVSESKDSPPPPKDPRPPPTATATTGQTASSSKASYKLSDLAWTRSGDKGDTCNIGVIAKDKANYPLLLQSLTADKVAEYFAHKFQPGIPRSCIRYEVPGIYGLNFVLEKSLGGGGIASLTPDPQGKGYAQMLLDIPISSS